MLFLRPGASMMWERADGGLQSHVPAKIPMVALVLSTLLSVITLLVVLVCLSRRIVFTRDWRKIPLTRWLIFAIYTDSIVFTICTITLEHGFGLNSSQNVCSAAILICIACYLTTKIILYYFLIEKVYIIRRVQTSRLKSKLYCFNLFGLLLPYCGIVILTSFFHVAYFNENGTCINGIKLQSTIPLIVFDAFLNLYLTLLFVLPLRSLYSYKNNPNSMLRTIALRSFIGSIGTLISTILNLALLVGLHGEASWICLMCCNGDVLFSVLVLHWVTSKDSTGSTQTDSRSPHNQTHTGGPSHSTNPTSKSFSKSHNSSSTRNKFASFGIYGKKETDQRMLWEMGHVRTHISGGKGQFEDSEEGLEEGRDLNGAGKGQINMTVEVGQVVSIDERDEGLGGKRSPVGTEKSEVEEGERRKWGGSEEDLVERVEFDNSMHQ